MQAVKEYLKGKLKYQTVLVFVWGLWLFSFPSKGAAYQLGLYLLPVLVLSCSETRRLLLEKKKEFFILALCLVLPMLLSELRAVLLYGGSFSKNSFHVLWRLSLLPITFVSMYQYCGLKVDHIRRLCVAAILFYASVALFMAVGGGQIRWRESGFVHNPNPFGILMVMGVLLVLIGLLRATSSYQYWLNLSALCLVVPAVILSGSRSAWLAGLFSIGFVLIDQRQSLKRLWTWRGVMFLFLGGAVVGYVVFIYDHGTFSELISFRVDSMLTGDIRFKIWQGYLAIADQYPLLGNPIVSEQKVMVGGNLYGPHNMYLSIFVKAGLLGLFSLLAALLWLFVRSFNQIAVNRSISASMLIALCLYCFFNSSFLSHVMTQSLFAISVSLVFWVSDTDLMDNVTDNLR